MKKYTGLNRIHCFVIAIFFFFSTNGFATSFFQADGPYPAGDLLGFDEALSVLRIEKKEIKLDLSRRPGACSVIRYEVFHPGEKDIEADLFFITRFPEKLSLTVEQKRYTAEKTHLEEGKSGWPLQGYRYGRLDYKGMDAGKFRIIFPAQRKIVMEISFVLPGGKTRAPGKGIFPAEMMHWSSWDMAREEMFVFAFCNESASFFRQQQPDIRVTIVLPAEYTMEVNLAFGKKEVSGGLSRYDGVYTKALPPLVEIQAVQYSDKMKNLLGGTFAIGFVTDYGAYTEFKVQALADVYFYHHQISLGMEGNPFGAEIRLQLPLLYTFFFGEEDDIINVVLGGGVSLTAGALFEVAPVLRTGFRISLAMCLGVRYEMAFDFYPFETVNGFDWQMTFLFLKVSI